MTQDVARSVDNRAELARACCAIARDAGAAIMRIYAGDFAVERKDDELVDLEEGAGIEQELDPFAGQELAALTLALDRCGRPGVRRLLAQPLDRLDPLAGGSGRHRGGSLPKSSRSGRMPRRTRWGQKGVQMQRIGENPP